MWQLGSVAMARPFRPAALRSLSVTSERAVRVPRSMCIGCGGDMPQELLQLDRSGISRKRQTKSRRYAPIRRACARRRRPGQGRRKCAPSAATAPGGSRGQSAAADAMPRALTKTKFAERSAWLKEPRGIPLMRWVGAYPVGSVRACSGAHRGRGNRCPDNVHRPSRSCRLPPGGATG